MERALSSSQASASRPCMENPRASKQIMRASGTCPRRSPRRYCTAVCAKLNRLPLGTTSSSGVASAAVKGTIGCQPCMDGTIAVPIDESQVITRFVAETLLPTRYGKFRVRGYKHSVDGGMTFTEPTAIISGAVEGQENVPVRVHDACFTSEVLGSLKCDCAGQLAIALETIYKNQFGMVIYLQQEGRGIGLANKIAAYSLQEQGLDTVDANRALGLPDDCREYTSVRNIIQNLGIKSIQLITNNPRKINELRSLGLNITGRLPCIVEQANEFNAGYLQAKRDRMDHLLEGQFCFWNHDGEPTQSIPTNSVNGGMGLPDGVVADGNGRVEIASVVVETQTVLQNGNGKPQ